MAITMQSDTFRYQLLVLTQLGRGQNKTKVEGQSAKIGRMCHFLIKTRPTLKDEHRQDSQALHLAKGSSPGRIRDLYTGTSIQDWLRCHPSYCPMGTTTLPSRVKKPKREGDHIHLLRRDLPPVPHTPSRNHNVDSIEIRVWAQAGVSLFRNVQTCSAAAHAASYSMATGVLSRR